jgi:hypothetical protein
MQTFFYWVGMIIGTPLLLAFLFIPGDPTGKPRRRRCPRCGYYHQQPLGPNCYRR